MKIRTGFVSNSSSSCFICDYPTDRGSIQDVTVKLKEMVSFYNSMFDQKYSYEDVFNDPRKPTSEDIKLLSDYIGYYEPGEVRVKQGEVKNRLVIFSAEDNSIPYELWEIMCSVFKAERIHLG